MIDTLYIEEEVLQHPRTRDICDRYPNANNIICEHYGEIFNRNAQNFRLQKRKPALILAKKKNKFVLDAPQGYAIGGKHNYYFSHMMNCIYDCRYCFLQGMYRSAHYVLFVNYEDFSDEIVRIVRQRPHEDVYFFSGYDCDSLAFDPVTHFIQYFLPLFNTQPNAWLELRTKSTQVRMLLDRQPLENCVVAFSFSPEDITNKLEHKTPSLRKRLAALVKLQQRGWKIGLRFDPLLYHNNYLIAYGALFEEVFNSISVDQLHSVSIGAFRMPNAFFQNIVNLYPDETLFAGPLERNNGMVSYKKELEEEMLALCTSRLLEYIPNKLFFPCAI